MADHQIAHVYVRDPARIGRGAGAARGRRRASARCSTRPASASYGLDHERSGELVLIAEPDAWFTYYYWLDDARAPDYARTVDIHRKPGYDPVELFLDPAIRVPPLALGSRLVRKKLGFRTLMDVIPLDASLVKGSHGRDPRRPGEGPAADDAAGRPARGRRARGHRRARPDPAAPRRAACRRRRRDDAWSAARPTTCASPPARTSGTPAAPASSSCGCATARCRSATSRDVSLETDAAGRAARRAAGHLGDDRRHRRRPADDQRPAGARGVPSTGWRWCSAPAARCSTTPTLLPTYRSADRPPLLLGNLGAAQVRAPDAPERARAARRAARRRRPDRAPEPDPGGRAAGGRAATSPASRPGSPRSSRTWRRCRWWSRRSASGWTPPTWRCCATPASRRSTSRARAAPTGRSSRAGATSAPATSPPPSPTGACRPPTR